jgi:hypothetical protein
MQLKILAVLGLSLSSLAVANDTTVEFGKITSGNAGMKVTVLSSQRNDDGEGRFPGFAVVTKSDSVSLDLVNLAALARPQTGLHMETTSAVTDGFADTDILSGDWTPPNVIPSLGASNSSECAVSWSDAVGILPEPDGIFSFFDGYYCTTSSSTCTPSTQFSRYFGTGGPNTVSDGLRICYNGGLYGYSNNSVNYSMDGETAVNCTNICS